MELRHLFYFKTLAEELHFSNAAAKLFISQPPLSRQIKELEDELGVLLFNRSNKRVALTDAGKYFKAEVEKLFSGLEETKNVLRQIHQNESGELRIGYISSLYQSYLAEVLKAMRLAFPYVKTSLNEGPTLMQVKALEEGRLDVGILRAPVHSDQLQLRTLYFDPFVVVISQGENHFADQTELAVFLKKSSFIFFNKGFATYYNEKLIEICERMGFRPDIVHEANNVHSILQLIEAGLGVSILPASLQKQYGHLRVDFIALVDVPVTTEVVLAYKPANRNVALKWFIDHYNVTTGDASGDDLFVS